MNRQEACEILGISTGASIEEAHEKYRQLARHVHPDKTGANTAYQFRQIQEAWEYIRTSKSESPAAEVTENDKRGEWEDIKRHQQEAREDARHQEERHKARQTRHQAQATEERKHTTSLTQKPIFWCCYCLSAWILMGLVLFDSWETNWINTLLSIIVAPISIPLFLFMGYVVGPIFLIDSGNTLLGLVVSCFIALSSYAINRFYKIRKKEIPVIKFIFYLSTAYSIIICTVALIYQVSEGGAVISGILGSLIILFGYFVNRLREPTQIVLKKCKETVQAIIERQ